MPLYDYACSDCGRRIEVRHGIHEDGPQRCEACGGRLRRVLSPPAVHFKGSGWAKKERAATRPGSGASASKEGARTSTDGKAGAPSSTEASEPAGDRGAATPSGAADRGAGSSGTGTGG